MSPFSIITSAKYLVVKEVKSRGGQNEKGYYRDEQICIFIYFNFS